MKQEQISTLLNSFFISEDELNSRENFKEFANSLSDIIIDEFANNYLLSNPYLNVYLAHTDGSMLLKKIKSFLAFTLTASVDEEYVKRIHFIGSIHYSIKLEPAKVSYGFWALNEILNKLALVNEVVKENKQLISKLLRFVEHLMNDGYYIQQESKNNNRDEIHSFNIQNELYIGFHIHRLNMQKISLGVSAKDELLLESIESDVSMCSFGKTIALLKEHKKYEHIFCFSADEIEGIHNQWHQEFVSLKEALIKSDDITLHVHYENLKNLTDELKKVLDRVLKDSLEDGQLSLSSGMRAIHNMTEIFYEKSINKNINEHDILMSIKSTIEKTIFSELSWAIENIAVQSKKIEESEYTVIKQMRYKTQNIFVAIELKEDHSSSYLQEMITLLLEVLDLHLSVKERESSLINFADKAENANKSKDMFLANMSHELRTPLNAITGFSQILMMKKDTPDSVKKYVQKINIAGNNLLELVNTILDFAKLEAGKMQFKPALSNISDVINEVETLVSSLATKKNIALKIPNIISLNLFIDKTLFKQVLINLLTNAIKFTPDGGNVSLSIVYDADKHQYIFEVKDNGIGLSPEDIKKLFQAFSQVENSYQKEHKGTGLGLMISKKIIEELHNGLIWVESKENEGSSFFISMSTPMIESHTYSVHEAPTNAQNILIVEDSEDYQKLLIAHLKDTYTLTLTDTINRAKELLVKEKYDFIILDFFLTDGISSEILQFMEEENISIPTIVVSAEDEINISSSLSGSSNLECIINKKNIADVCTLLRCGKYSKPKE